MLKDLEQKYSSEPVQLNAGYKGVVKEEAERIAREQGVTLNLQVVRFPRVFVPSDTTKFKAVEATDFLIVDVGKIKELSGADKLYLRNNFSMELLRRLGFISEEAAIVQQMEGIPGNRIIELGHEVLPYKVEALVHDMGDREFLINGFVISPK